MIIAGARPNFMKIAPLVHAIQAHNQALETGAQIAQSPHRSPLDYRLVHTGQHYDQAMSEVFFRELGIPAPHENLEVGSGSHAVQTANVMTRFEPVLLREKPDWLVVVGDVNSTLACTLVAVKLGVKTAHVEAGLRSFDRSMPEEINRLATDAIADLLLTPSEDADENLRREGVAESRIKLVGNIMIDSLVANLDQARRRQTHRHLGLPDRGFVYVTLHRPSNVDHEPSLRQVMDELKHLARQLPVVFPIHPRTRKMLAEFHISVEGEPGLKIIDPIGYHDSLCLSEHARLVLTDSGGLQEETTFFQTPCLTLRPNTERPITVTVGSNRLTSIAQLRTDLETTLAKGSGIGRIPPLWDGHTAPRIVTHLLL
jgi:UDP-N-acetylglucosamine 2-epimerase (non-hydrolysing)